VLALEPGAFRKLQQYRRSKLWVWGGVPVAGGHRGFGGEAINAVSISTVFSLSLKNNTF